MKPLDLTKPMQLRDGRKYENFCSDYKGYPPYVLTGRVFNKDGREEIMFHRQDGRWKIGKNILLT